MAGTERRVMAVASAGRLDVHLRGDGGSEQFYFLSPAAALRPNNEAFIAAALLPAMRAGHDLRVDGPVSASFLDSLQTVMDIYTSWDASLARIHVVGAEPVVRPALEGRRVGAFFSGGLDSFHTLLRRTDEITDLILVHGFEIPVEDRALYERARRGVQQVRELVGTTWPGLTPVLRRVSGLLRGRRGRQQQ